MSDEKNMDGSAISSEAQAEVLSADNEIKSRAGFVGSQNTLADCIGRGVQVDAPNGQQSPVRPNDANGAASRDAANVANMSLGGRAVTVKIVGANHHEGSNKGDHRPTASDAKLPANPGPREGMGQTRFTGKREN